MNIKEKKKLQSNIWKFHAFNICGAMLFTVPIITLFWQENGLSLTQIMILQSLFSLAMVLLEIPTGYLADVHGRKNILVGSGFFIFLAISVYSIGYNFWSFLVAELLFAVGLSLFSGTGSALLYDTLLELKQEKHYNKIWGKSNFYRLLGAAGAQVIGGLIAKISLRWTLYTTIPFFFMLIPIALSMYEPKRHKMVIEKSHVHKMIKIVKYSFVENIKLRWLIIFFAIVYGLNSAGLWLWQPYFKLSGVDVVYFGIIFASFQIITAITSKYAYKIEEKIGQKISLIMLIPCIFLGYLLMSKIIFIYSFVFIYFFQLVRGYSEPLFSDYVNKLTTSDIRATVLSIHGLAERFVYALIIPFIGWLADVYSILQALTIAGIITIITGTIILYILHKDKVI